MTPKEAIDNVWRVILRHHGVRKPLGEVAPLHAAALKAYEEAVRAEEREACAQIADTVANYSDDDAMVTASSIADAIRAR